MMHNVWTLCPKNVSRLHIHPSKIALQAKVQTELWKRAWKRATTWIGNKGSNYVSQAKVQKILTAINRRHKS